MDQSCPAACASHCNFIRVLAQWAFRIRLRQSILGLPTVLSLPVKICNIALWSRWGSREFEVIGLPLLGSTPQLVAFHPALRQPYHTILVEEALSLAIDKDYISRMYSLALLFRMHGYFSRMVLHIPAVVESAEIRRGDPPAAAKLYHAELQDYCLCNHRRIVKGRTRFEVEEFACSDEEQEGHPEGGDQNSLEPRRLAWAEFRAIFNGHWNEGLVHYCTHPNCCLNYSEQETRRRMASALQKVMFQALPTVPVKSKRLQTGPCVDWFMMSMAVMPFLQALWPIAFGTGAKRRKTFTQTEEEIGYQELAGKRMTTGHAFVSAPSSPSLLIISGIVSEPLRFLTRWFLSRRSHANRMKEQSPLMDLANPVVSPIVRVLQYFASCLRGEASRLRLLWGGPASATFIDGPLAQVTRKSLLACGGRSPRLRHGHSRVLRRQRHCGLGS